jgi:hypothetical protein
MIGDPIPRIGGGLSGKNLKRHIFTMGQSVDILKTASSAPLPDSPPSNDPQFQGFGGETTLIQLSLRSGGLP